MSLRASTSKNPPSRPTFATSSPAQHNAPTTSNAFHAQSNNNAASTAVSTELEHTLNMLSSHRSALGYLLITRGPHPSIIRHSGVVFEGDQGKKYAAVIARIVQNVQSSLDELRTDDGIGPTADESDSNDIRFMRIRTNRHEIMISPDDRFLLAVLHDPAT